jgi:ubiquinone/menaquinone biosynthesis C-methylase UbiE
MPLDTTTAEKIDIKSNVRNFWEHHVNNEYYTRHSRGGTRYFEEITRRRYQYHYHLPELFDTLDPSEGNRLLELGCGIGIDATSLAEKGFRVTGVDLTQAALNTAIRREWSKSRGVQYCMADGEALPFPSNHFDCVYSFGVLHHTPDMRRAIEEIRRVLRPGGICVAMFYAKYSLVNAVHVLLRLPYESPESSKDHCPVVQRMTGHELYRLFSGFPRISMYRAYPFTYGMRFLYHLLPNRIFRALGRHIGWHYMVRAEKGD